MDRFYSKLLDQFLMNLKEHNLEVQVIIFNIFYIRVYQTTQWSFSLLKTMCPTLTSFTLSKLYQLVMNPSEPMQEYLRFIEAFADTMAGTFKQFAHICRQHLKKSSQKNQLTDTRAQLIEERKKRLELQQKIKNILIGSNQSEMPTSEEKKRPKNAFALFVADQRDKMLGSSPSLTFQKITSLALLKWKRMSEQQKKIYEKKFQEMMKLYEEKERMQKNKKSAGNLQQNNDSDAAFIKREAIQPEKAPEEEENEDNAEEKEKERIENEEEIQGQQVGATFVIQNQEQNQPTLQMEIEPQVEPRPLENLLNLFHTPIPSQNSPQGQIQDKEAFNNELNEKKSQEEKQGQEKPQESVERLEQNQNKDGQQGPSFQPENEQVRAEEKVFIDPSVQIIQQIVIDPTIQQPQK